MMASDKAIHSHATDHKKQTPSNVKPEGILEKKTMTVSTRRLQQAKTQTRKKHDTVIVYKNLYNGQKYRLVHKGNTKATPWSVHFSILAS